MSKLTRQRTVLQKSNDRYWRERKGRQNGLRRARLNGRLAQCSLHAPPGSMNHIKGEREKRWQEKAVAISEREKINQLIRRGCHRIIEKRKEARKRS